jgi:chromosomal replication initiation ATPase DnaA
MHLTNQLRAEIDDLEQRIALLQKKRELEVLYDRLASNEKLRERFDPIIEVVCKAFGVAKRLVLSPHSGRIKASDARHVAIALICEQGVLNEDAGRIFGQHRTTVIYAKRSVERKMDTEKAFRERVEKVKAEIERKERAQNL